MLVSLAPPIAKATNSPEHQQGEDLPRDSPLPRPQPMEAFSWLSLFEKHCCKITQIMPFFFFMVHKDLLHQPEPALLEKGPAAQPVEGAAGGSGWVGDSKGRRMGVPEHCTGTAPEPKSGASCSLHRAQGVLTPPPANPSLCKSSPGQLLFMSNIYIKIYTYICI